MLTVHHLENSRSQRVLWLLEELEVPYEIVRYARNPQTMLAPPELKKIHPLGKSPVIVDGTHTIAETGAIVEYVLEKYGQGRLVPADKQKLRFWLHYAEGSAMPWLFLKLVFMRLAPGSPWALRPLVSGIAKMVGTKFLNPQIRTHLDFWESELGEGDWLVGNELSAADIMMSFPVEGAAQRAFRREERPVLAKYLDRIHARPAYQRALERGGPYDYA